MWRECTSEDWARNTKSLDWRRVRVHDELVGCIERALTPPARVLEIGAQTGKDALALSRKGYKVSAIDYNLPAVGLLGRHEEVAAAAADGLRLPFREGAFDLIYSQGLLEHFRDPELGVLLEEQRRVVRDGGYVLVDVPNTFSLNTLPKQVLIAAGKWIVPWETQYSLTSLRALGESHNLRFVKGYAWGYDKFIGERARRLASLLAGEDAVLRAERSHGHYFMKCVGALFEKPQ